jgi:phospholipid transport system transporter-binding protein
VSEAKLEALGEGRYRVSGELDAATVVQVLQQSEQQFPGTKQLEIDLGGVAHSDSAGLALLIEWLREARRRSQQIRFHNVPQQLHALAQISEVDQLFAANGG